MKLVPHPDHAPLAVESIDASVWRHGDRWHFRFLVEGIDDFVLPASKQPERTDELWRQTCFEAFVAFDGGGYVELNFSPSSQWSAYRFDEYRSGMREEAAEVEIWLDAGETWLGVEAAVRCEALAAGSMLGLSAVIRERASTSYWALGHSEGAPDFHDRACFKALLGDIAHS